MQDTWLGSTCGQRKVRKFSAYPSNLPFGGLDVIPLNSAHFLQLPISIAILAAYDCGGIAKMCMAYRDINILDTYLTKEK